MKKAGIYNRWLATLGGGEKHSLAIAERISQTMSVEVINHQAVDKEIAAARLDIDLSRVSFKVIPERSATSLPEITREYDLFINASHLDYFPSLAKHAATLIYFPARLDLYTAVRRNLKKTVREWLQLPKVISGVYSFQFKNGILTWYCDPFIKIVLPPSQREYIFSFDLARMDARLSRMCVSIGSEVVQEIAFDRSGQAQCTLTIPGHPQDSSAQVSISPLEEPSIDTQPKLKLSRLQCSLPRYQLYQQLFEHRIQRIAYMFQFFPPAYAILDYLKTYDVVWANSQFTQKWIRRYWHRDSQVLYPFINVEKFQPLPKKHRILNVGRFFAGQHNKKHAELVHAFRNMVDKGLSGWELHLAGGITKGAENQAYFEGIQSASVGYPIYLHPDVPFEQLVQLYGDSDIYWHASGYGENERKYPDKFEHFGITTVEAMAAGCCPVVIGKGGQPEIVRSGQNGFLWNDLSELEALTWNLINNPGLREEISQQARLTSTNFDRTHFHQRIDDFLKKIEF